MYIHSKFIILKEIYLKFEFSKKAPNFCAFRSKMRGIQPLKMTLTIIIANECDAYQRLLSYFKLSCLEIEKQYHVSITQFNLF